MPPEPSDRNAALAAFFAEHAGRLHDVLTSFLGDECHVDEALGFAITKLVERTDIDPAEAGGWVFTVARNEAFRLTRIASRTDSLEFEMTSPERGPGLTLADVIPGPDDTAATAERRERIAALADLKPDEAQALNDRVEGYSYAEIAEAHGFTYTKVNRSLREGRDALRRRERLIELETQERIEIAKAAVPARLPSLEHLERRERIAARRETADRNPDRGFGR